MIFSLEEESFNNNIDLGGEPGMPGEMEALFKRIKKLAEYLPDHNVEIQFELYGPNTPPHRKLVHMRKVPARTYHFRDPDPLRADPVVDSTSPFESKMTPVAPTTPYSQSAGAHLPPMNLPPIDTGGANGMEEKKPVYMDDLKKALKEFEERVFSKQDTSMKKTESPADAKVIEEGKQPLLKKDLWMALGLKFLKGCSDQSHDHNMQTPRPGMPAPTGPTVNITPRPQIINLPAPASGPYPTSMPGNPRVNNLLHLIRRGVKVEPNNMGLQRAPASEDNIEWLQIKIPKPL